MHKGIYVLFVLLLLVARLEAADKGRGKLKHVKLKTTRRLIILNTLCKVTLYPDACIETLGSARINLSDSNQFVKLAFQVAKTALITGINQLPTINEAKLEARSAEALNTCNETMMYALNDMEESVNAMGSLGNGADIGGFLEDLKVWVGGSLTYQDVCYDAFEGASDTTPGMKIQSFFSLSRMLTSNALALMERAHGVVNFIHNVNPLHGLLLGNREGRRLLKKSKRSSGLMPPWIADAQRNLLTVPLAQIRPDVIVAKDGSGQFKTIQDAINTHPNVSKKNPEAAANPYIIYVKAGVYKEIVTVGKKQHNVVLIGDGPTKTIVTNNKNFVDGTPTFKTATAGFLGDGFMARDMGFENSAGPSKHQAVAVKVTGDFAVFFNCIFDGFQDTLYPIRGRQFYRDCTIKGTIDFIFGDAQAVFQNCRMVVKKPMNNQACAVTAQGRNDPNGPGAIVLQKCSIVADEGFSPETRAFLGRPWKLYSRTIIMNTFIDGFIAPAGWSEWQGTRGLNTLFYSEFQNTGPGSALDNRVRWPGIKYLQPAQIVAFTPDAFFKGSEWIVPTGAPYVPGMMA